jgi:two-component system, chemotaxis family, sensor kinase CheA
MPVGARNVIVYGEMAMTQHILVVEDEEAFGLVVKRMLESAGFRVSTAKDFVTALHIVEGSEHIDLLLADVNMPAGTPHGLSIGLMAESKRQDLKIVYMTGSVDPAQIAQYAPSAKLLRKPFTTQQLLEMIRATLAEP